MASLAINFERNELRFGILYAERLRSVRRAI